MHPWVGYMMMPNNVSGNDGQYDTTHKDASKWYYTYQKKNDHKSEIILERLPMRNIQIHTPNLYQGHTGKDANSLEFSYLNRHFFINGLINVEDGSFLSGFFVSDIDRTNIVIGPYPLYPIDIEQIARTGVKAVLNLQTPSEVADREADVKLLDQSYRSKGINTFFNVPIDD